MQARSQSQKFPFRKPQELSLDFSSITHVQQSPQRSNRDTSASDKKKPISAINSTNTTAATVITISSLAEKLLDHSKMHASITWLQDKYFRRNIVRLAEVLQLKREFPKYILANAIPFAKMLNTVSSLFIDVPDLDASSKVLELALRICQVAQTTRNNEEEGFIQLIVVINNLAVLLQNLHLGKQYLKTAIYLIEKNSKQPVFFSQTIMNIEGITRNNLCGIYQQLFNYEKVYAQSEKTLLIKENNLIKQIKEEGPEFLKENKQFLNDLQILLQSYFYRGWSLEECRNVHYQRLIIEEDDIDNQLQSSSTVSSAACERERIYMNGRKLSSVFYGKDSKICMIFENLLQKLQDNETDNGQNQKKKKTSLRRSDVELIYGETFKAQNDVMDRLYVIQEKLYNQQRSNRERQNGEGDRINEDDRENNRQGIATAGGGSYIPPVGVGIVEGDQLLRASPQFPSVSDNNNMNSNLNTGILRQRSSHDGSRLMQDSERTDQQDDHKQLKRKNIAGNAVFSISQGKSVRRRSIDKGMGNYDKGRSNNVTSSENGGINSQNSNISSSNGVQLNNFMIGQQQQQQGQQQINNSSEKEGKQQQQQQQQQQQIGNELQQQQQSPDDTKSQLISVQMQLSPQQLLAFQQYLSRQSSQETDQKLLHSQGFGALPVIVQSNGMQSFNQSNNSNHTNNNNNNTESNKNTNGSITVVPPLQLSIIQQSQQSQYSNSQAQFQQSQQQHQMLLSASNNNNNNNTLTNKQLIASPYFCTDSPQSFQDPHAYTTQHPYNNTNSQQQQQQYQYSPFSASLYSNNHNNNNTNNPESAYYSPQKLTSIDEPKQYEYQQYQLFSSSHGSNSNNNSGNGIVSQQLDFQLKQQQQQYQQNQQQQQQQQQYHPNNAFHFRQYHNPIDNNSSDLLKSTLQARTVEAALSAGITAMPSQLSNDSSSRDAFTTNNGKIMSFINGNNDMLLSQKHTLYSRPTGTFRLDTNENAMMMSLPRHQGSDKSMSIPLHMINEKNDEQIQQIDGQFNQSNNNNQQQIMIMQQQQMKREYEELNIANPLETDRETSKNIEQQQQQQQSVMRQGQDMNNTSTPMNSNKMSQQSQSSRDQSPLQQQQTPSKTPYPQDRQVLQNSSSSSASPFPLKQLQRMQLTKEIVSLKNIPGGDSLANTPEANSSCKISQFPVIASKIDSNSNSNKHKNEQMMNNKMELQNSNVVINKQQQLQDKQITKQVQLQQQQQQIQNPIKTNAMRTAKRDDSRHLEAQTTHKLSKQGSASQGNSPNANDASYLTKLNSASQRLKLSTSLTQATHHTLMHSQSQRDPFNHQPRSQQSSTNNLQTSQNNLQTSQNNLQTSQNTIFTGGQQHVASPSSSECSPINKNNFIHSYSRNTNHNNSTIAQPNTPSNTKFSSKSQLQSNTPQQSSQPVTSLNGISIQQSEASLNRQLKLSESESMTPINSQHQHNNNHSISNFDYLSHVFEILTSTHSELSSVTKCILFNQDVYCIQIALTKNATETFFELSGYQNVTKAPLGVETLSLKILKGVLNLLDLSEGTPFNKPFKTVQGFRDMCQFLIFPFIQVNAAENKIEINSSLTSMIQYKRWSIDFLNQSYQATIHHLNRNEFKLSLRNSNDKEQLRLDLNFDEATMKSCFEKIEHTVKDQKEENESEDAERDEIKDIVDLCDWFDEDDCVNIKNKSAKLNELRAKMVRMKPTRKHNIVNYDIPNSITFIPKIKELLALVQTFLLNMHNYTSLSQYSEEHGIKVLRANIQDDFKRGQIFLAKESPFSTSISVSIQNIHFSHAPESKMIQQVGKKDVELSEFQKVFGISYENLDKDERYYFLTLLALKHSLYTFSKPLEEDDLDRYNANPIINTQTTIGGYNRSLIGNTFKYPITFQLFGIEDIAYGVRATFAELENSSEQGVFFIVDGESWAKFKRQEDPNAKKKRSKKYKDEFGIIKNYELANVLGSVGYQLLEHSLSFRIQESPLPPQLIGKKLLSGIVSNTDRLENIISLEEVSNYLLAIFT